jgi:hypothetical protein
MMDIEAVTESGKECFYHRERRERREERKRVRGGLYQGD